MAASSSSAATSGFSDRSRLDPQAHRTPSNAYLNFQAEVAAFEEELDRSRSRRTPSNAYLNFQAEVAAFEEELDRGRSRRLPGDRGGNKGGGRGGGGGDRQGGDRGKGGKQASQGSAGPAPKAAPAAKKAPAADGAQDVDTSKSTLNVVCMKLLKRPMQKGEIVYDAPQTPGGFQSSLRLPCLPEPWGTKQWTGKVCMNRKAAEQDAAEKALVDIKAAPEFADVLKDSEGTPGAPKKKKEKGEAKDGEGKGKGKGKGKMFPWLDFAWGKGGKAGPDLPREAVGEGLVQGEVAEWRGNFGWIKPAEGAITHEGLSRRGGRVYVHKQDLQGAETLEAGAKVKFKVYSDSSGLGAAEVVVA